MTWHVPRRKGPPTSRRRATLLDKHTDKAPRAAGEATLPPTLMNVADLATLLRTSKNAIYNRHARGEIPGSLRLGRSLRFDPRIIAKWLATKGAGAGLEDEP